MTNKTEKDLFIILGCNKYLQYKFYATERTFPLLICDFLQPDIGKFKLHVLSCLPRFITVYQAHFVFLVQRIIDYFSRSKTRLAEEKFVQFKRKTKFPVHRSRIIPCLHPPEYPFFSGEREREREKEKTRGIENVSPLKIRVDRSIDRLIKRGGVSGS